MKKYDKAFNTDTDHLDWEKIYLLPSKVTSHTRLREFQYKTLNRILYTNEMFSNPLTPETFCKKCVFGYFGDF